MMVRGVLGGIRWVFILRDFCFVLFVFVVGGGGGSRWWWWW